MNQLWEGIQVGLILCFLLGPIFFVLVQTGVEQGFRAGAVVGLGVWLSDLMFFLAVFHGLRWINQLVRWPWFEEMLGLGGSLVLVLFGLGAILHQPAYTRMKPASTVRVSSYLDLFARGFLVNTLNPFTIFFWMGLMSTVILSKELSTTETSFYASGIIGTIAATDLAKVAMAKRIRRHLRFRYLLWFRRLSGAALILFGLALFLRAVWLH